MNDDIGKVNNPDRDHRVRDAQRFIHDRRQECLSMIALWEKSRKPHAAEDLRYWRDELASIDRKAAQLEQRDQRRPSRLPDELKEHPPHADTDD